MVKTLDKSQLFDKTDKTVIPNFISTVPEIEYFSKMSKDGVYIDYIKKIIYTYNIQKVEQRCLREGKKDWFRSNGDLRLENDIFSDIITKPLDISLNTNDKYDVQLLGNQVDRTSERNFKRYKMKIFISKLFFKFHPYFSDEDILCSEMREYYRDFYQEMNKLQIPYLKDKILTITKQLDEYSQYKEPSESIKLETKYMKIFVQEAMKFLEDGKKNLNIKANLLYNKWLELKNLRDMQKYKSTNLRLNVLKFPTTNKENPNIFDYGFVLTYSEPTQEEKILPKTEIERRNKVKKLKCFIKIYVNGIYVTESPKYTLIWPNFELDINNLFNLNVYTRPTKIEFEIYLGSSSYTKISRFEVEAPGIFMNTVTSTAPIFEEIGFGSGENNTDKLKQEQKLNKLEYSNTIISKGEEADKLLQSSNKNNILIDKNNKKTFENTYKGRIFIKAEWEGQAPDMPPTKIDDKGNLIKKQLNFKDLITKINSYDYPFDINDPRNIMFFEQMKKKKTELLLKYLRKEYMLSFYDMKSLRHYLLSKRLEKFSLKKEKIPILEDQIDRDQKIKAIIKSLENEKVNETDEEYEKKIKTQLEKLNSLYSGRVLTEEEYFEMLSKKIKTLRRDIVNKLQLSYFQIINEFYYSPDLALVFKEMCVSLLSPPRKLAPRRKRKTAAKVEKTSEIKINIHIVKGYNIPVRNESLPSSLREQLKSHAIGQAYKSSVGSYNYNMNQLYKRSFSQRGMELGGLGNQGNQNPNYPFGMVNNSGAFATPNILTGNQSLVGGINMNVNDLNAMNNLNQNIGSTGMPNMMGSVGMQGVPGMFNPNLNNVMVNPNMPNFYPTYNLNQPNLYMGQVNIPPQIKSYDGDILQMVELLKSVEKIVESLIQVKMIYYDQEIEMRTDSIEGLHPDYNHKMQFIIKPKDKKEFFSRDELTRCPGTFYFTLYDECRSEQKIQEKIASTYIYRYEKKYLGAFQIPFSTIIQNANLLETVCKVSIPLTVFGYYSDTSSTYDVLHEKEEDMRKRETLRDPNLVGNNNLDQAVASNSSFRLSDSKYNYLSI